MFRSMTIDGPNQTEAKTFLARLEARDKRDQA
jgi:hypothetical protein